MISIGTQSFRTLAEAKTYVRALLHGHDPESPFGAEDTHFLGELLMRHPRGKEKLGCGIERFIIRVQKYGAKCFHVVRLEGTIEKFSYKKCLML